MAAREGLAFRSLSGFSCPYPLPFAQVRSATAGRCPVLDEALLRRELLAALGPGDVLSSRHLAQLRPDDNPESRYAHRLDAEHLNAWGFARLEGLLAGRPQ